MFQIRRRYFLAAVTLVASLGLATTLVPAFAGWIRGSHSGYGRSATHALTTALASARSVGLQLPFEPGSRVNSGGTVGVGAVGCADDGPCLLIAGYSGTHVNGLLTMTEDGGVWGASQAIPGSGATGVSGLTGTTAEPPVTTGELGPTFGAMGPEAVSCVGPGRCVAVGSYSLPPANQQIMASTWPAVMSEANGSWGAVAGVRLPEDAAGRDSPITQQGFRFDIPQAASLQSISCPSPDDCVAVGSYTTKVWTVQPIAATEHDGVWGPAIRLPLPTDALEPVSTDTGAAAASVSCTAVNTCIAVGSYTYDKAGDSRGFIDTDADGSWTSAPVPLVPGQAHPSFGGLRTLSCPTTTTCYAFGNYSVTRHHGRHSRATVRTILVTDHNGVWSSPQPISGYGFSPQSSACTGAGECVVAGLIRFPFPSHYLPPSAQLGFRAGLLEQTPAGWSTAATAPLPANAYHGKFAPFSFFNSIACTPSGTCIAFGRYEPDRPLEQGVPGSSALTTTIVIAPNG